MKVFLVQAAAYFPEIERAMPLGIMYLASYARERYGCEVRLFDMQLRHKTTAPVLKAMRDFAPDLIGISGMSPDADVIKTLVRESKRLFPNVPVVVGGSYASYRPDDLLGDTPADYLIPNEGEAAFGALLEHLRGERDLATVPSVIYRREGELQRNPVAPFIENLDALPVPAYDLLDLDAYYDIPRCGVIYTRRRYAALVTSRGCPFHCAFCHGILGKKNRMRTAENVVDEMAWLVRDYGVGEFIVMDDMFNFSPERVNKISQLIVERGLDIGLHFPIGLRGDIMTEESVRLLKKAGMFRCMYAVETGTERLQQLVHKHNRLDKLKHIIEFTRDQGVMVHGTFMLGFPTETAAEARATVKWAVDSKLHTAAFFRVIPFWGTELYDMARAAGKVLPTDMRQYEFHSSDTINISEMPDAELGAIKRRAYRRFYLSARRIWSILRVLPNKPRMLPTLFVMWVRKALLW